MPASTAELAKAFDELAITQQPAFANLVRGRRLQYTGTSTCVGDVIDDYSSRLICECIAKRTSLLLVWPDDAERRSALALAVAIVCDSVPRLGAGTKRSRILYLGTDTSVREQFASVRVGTTALTGVFAQEFGRGDGPIQRVGPESTLPYVTTIVSPAQPEKILRDLRPRWIAVDCGHKNAPPWLPGLLAAAKAMGIPVIGWATTHISSVAPVWRGHGACVYRWPKSASSDHRIESLDELMLAGATTTVLPLLLSGELVDEVAGEFAKCYLGLVRHTGRVPGQLGRDALATAWRYLRLLETLPVSPDIYDAECSNYWGMPPLGRLKAALERFLHALNTEHSLRADLSEAFERLAAAERLLRENGSPTFSAVANLVVDGSTPSLYVFPNGAYRDLFRLSLVSKFNITEQDLNSLGVSLASLADVVRDKTLPKEREVTVVGMPTRNAEWRIEGLLDHEQIRVLVWPHLEQELRRRAVEWSSSLGAGCDGPSPLRSPPARQSNVERVQVSQSRTVDAHGKAHGFDPLSRAATTELWKRPDALAAISSLYGADQLEDEGIGDATTFKPDLDISDEGAVTQSEEWVEEALHVTFSDGGQILLPLDDCVNVVMRSAEGVRVEPRFSRSIRVGDELLLVHGEHRRSVYDLLVSRVHTHKTISPWLRLVERWHEDLRKAFILARRRAGATFESVLTKLRQQGSAISTAASVRGWILGVTLAPSDWQDVRRLGEILDISIAKQYPREIGVAASKLAGLHRSLSNRLNRWLESESTGAAALSGAQAVIDAELGLTIDDFRHSLVRGRVTTVAQVQGPFLRTQLGHLRR